MITTDGEGEEGAEEEREEEDQRDVLTLPS